MVISAMPILCETSARWLAEGRSSANDRAELERDIAAAGKQRSNIRKAGFNMGSSPFKRLLAARRQSIFLYTRKPDFSATLSYNFIAVSFVSCVCQYTLLQPACFAY